ncbi:hypothetical protein [Streptomyces canus]|uniref:hypothetical protein n=1 Tax=Streptomyces canus TaxID=58343 RepID=UPI002254C2EF|nr:hypothetical protein [Streptomyces canus]MCX4860331.1 hypothetical protein [Streptomyces canus]
MRKDRAARTLVDPPLKAEFFVGGYSYAGCAATGPGKLLNLNEPGVVRHLIDEATDPGLLPGAAELEGWDLFDAVLSRAAAATPAAPPGCPPGP